PGQAACGWAEACGCVEACGGSGQGDDSARFTVTEVGFSGAGCGGLAATFGFGLGFALGFSGSAAAAFCSGMAAVISGSAAGWWPFTSSAGTPCGTPGVPSGNTALRSPGSFFFVLKISALKRSVGSKVSIVPQAPSMRPSE